MTNIMLLNNVEHHDLRVMLGHAAAFGDAVNQTLIFPTEFEEAQREYPILFQRAEDGRYQAVVLLGLDRDENLYLEQNGWTGRYVPAIHQRGPFLIGFQEREVEGERIREPMIHVDLDHPRIRRGGEEEGSQPLFLAQGGHAPYLDHEIRILRVIHDGLEVGQAMYEAFAEHGLIEPVRLQISLDETTRYDLPDYHTVSAEKLQQLDGAALEKLHRAGFLRAAFNVVQSMGNISRLIDMKNRKREAGRVPEIA
ncbi:SapC family protein [Sphingomonas sp. PR090111-T3T-6A]|uniref:SapC family protein n=1 Tax=Sphingomonas sp. PR090111-T3T-6A TaxID=685778 RepID=UPI0003A3D37D|nr:SapC family protein [Sphingomonas sp. PR090111-T3T-6A]